MIKPRHWDQIKRALLIVLVGVLVLQPVAAAAQPLHQPLPDPIETLANSGDLYMTGVGQAGLLSMELVPVMEAINESTLTELSEEAISEVRSKARNIAEQSAIALGAADDLADSIAILSNELPEAIEVYQIASEGIPEDMALDLIENGDFSPSQVDAFEAALQATGQTREDVSEGGLPSEYVDQLLAAGFEASDIDMIAQSIGVRGLADEGLGTALAQFRASQDELAGIRTRALFWVVQLLGRQIGVRQANGIQARPVTEDELAELANDELRLLIHVAHLDELWGEDPQLEVGEGDWWFIERYATRAAERIEALTLDSQNRALVVDLLLLEQMRTLAISARSGDPDYVKPELDRLAELLETQLGEEGFVTGERSKVVGVTKVAAKLASIVPLRERITWPVERSARTAVVRSSDERLKAHGVINLLDPQGLIPEIDETNNELGMLFASGLPYLEQLSADVLLAALDLIAFINNGDMLAWIEAILTGETDDPKLMVGNVLFSLIPVVGVIPDIVSLVRDPSVFVKALSVFGIIGSLGDLVGLIPGLQGVGGASFLGDAASAVLKSLFKHADEVVRIVLNGMKLDDAFGLIIDVIKRLAHFAGDTLGGSLDEVIKFITDIFTGNFRLWDDFQHFVAGVGGSRLVTHGFDEGGQLVGRIFGLSDELAASLGDDAIDGLLKFGKKLPDYGLDFAKMSDEAMVGLGKVWNDVGEEGVVRLLDGIKGQGGDIVNATLKVVGDVGYPVTWSDEAIDGIKNIILLEETIPALGPQKIKNLIETVKDPELINKTFHILEEINSPWSDEAMEGVARLIEVTKNQDLERIYRVLDGTSRKTVGEAMFRRIKLASDADIKGWRRFADEISKTPNHARGGFHVLDFMESKGFENITELEVQLIRNIPEYGSIERVYDVVIGSQRFELKNIAEMGSKQVDQLRRDLLLLTEQELRDLKWVFRGPENQQIVDEFIRTIKNVNEDLYKEGIFTENNLEWFGTRW